MRDIHLGETLRLNIDKETTLEKWRLPVDEVRIEEMIARLPRYHDLIAAGVDGQQAMTWHEAIRCIEGHAINMAEGIEEGADNLRQRAVWFRSAQKARDCA